MKIRSDEKITDFQNQLLKQYLKALNYSSCSTARYLIAIRVLEIIRDYLFNINQIKESQIINEFIEKMKGWL